MSGKLNDNRKVLKIMLILTALATTCLFYKMYGYKMVVLHLFYLPIVLSGFFLGRYHAGLLAVFCVMSASLLAFMDWTEFAAYSSPIIIGLAVTVWGATLGLTAILVGTLSDDRTAKMKELHTAYIGVVEVLSRYLQSANPHLKARSERVAELSQMVAARMRLNPKQIDDIRVAALLYDIGKIEITTKLINKAVNSLQANPQELGHDTFQGTELLQSLSSALSADILPLLDPDFAVYECSADEAEQRVGDAPVGARIIRTVRAYDDLTQGALVGSVLAPHEAIKELRADKAAEHDHVVMNALQHTVWQAADELVEQAESVF